MGSEMCIRDRNMTNSVQGAELVSGWLPVYGPDTVAEIEALLRQREASKEKG